MPYPTKKLGEVIDLNYGKGIDRSYRKTDGEYPIYGANGELGRTDKFLVEGEGIIVGRKGSAGEVMRVSGKYWPSDVTYYIFGNKNVDIEYLFYFLKEIDLTKLAVGVKPGINRNRVYELEIPLPPLPEQKKIVKKIEELFGKIDEAQKLREEAQADAAALIPAALDQIFEKGKKEGWPEEPFKKVCIATQGEQIPKSEHINASKKGYRRYLYISDFYSEKKLKYVVDNYPKKVVTDQDIIIANTGSPGKVFKGIDGVLSNNLFKVSFDRKKVSREYLHLYLSSQYFQKKLQAQMKGGAQQHLGHKTMSKQIIPLPPLPEQKKIVAYLDLLSEKAKKLQALQQQTAEDMKALKQSILQKAFGGEMVKT